MLQTPGRGDTKISVHMSNTSSYASRVTVGRTPGALRRLCAHAPLRRRWLAGVVTLVIVGGCGSSHVTLQSAPSTISGGGSATVPQQGSGTSSTITPDSGQDAAILAAYEGSLADFNAVANKAPVHGNSIILADHMTGDKLQTVEAALLKLSMASEVNNGSLSSLHARVTQFNGTEAVVESCELDKEAVESTSTGKVITPASNATELVNELVQLTGGVWKVSRGSQVKEGCS